jgi:hypothetical protein
MCASNSTVPLDGIPLPDHLQGIRTTLPAYNAEYAVAVEGALTGSFPAGGRVEAWNEHCGD